MATRDWPPTLIPRSSATWVGTRASSQTPPTVSAAFGAANSATSAPHSVPGTSWPVHHGAVGLIVKAESGAGQVILKLRAGGPQKNPPDMHRAGVIGGHRQFAGADEVMSALGDHQVMVKGLYADIGGGYRGHARQIGVAERMAVGGGQHQGLRIERLAGDADPAAQAERH